MLTVWACWLRRRASRTPLAHTLRAFVDPCTDCPGSPGWHRRSPSASALAADVLGHAELIAYPDALVADLIHHLPHQEDSVPADRAFAQARRDVRRRHRERVELGAVVLDRHVEPGVGQPQRHFDPRRAARRRAVDDYVHEDFL